MFSATALEQLKKEHLLSKSTYLMGKQCPKMLYLNTFHKSEKEAVSKATQVLFSFGKKFEEAFRAKFTLSMHLADTLQHQFHLYAGYTQKLIEEQPQVTQFEAGVFYDEVLVLVDVLQVNPDGQFSIYEIKYTHKISPVVLWDLAIQYYVCKNSLQKIESFNVVLKDKKSGFRIKNMANVLEKEMSKIAIEIQAMKAIIKGETTPQTTIGSQCFRPYRCPYFNYCRK